MVWEELRDDLIFIDLEARTSDEVFQKLGGVLTEKGFGKDTYVKALIDREAEYPTGLNIDGCGIAIPHTPVDFVNESATCIGILKEPVKFLEMGTDEDVAVKIVFVLCVTDPQKHMEQLQRIVSIIQDKEVLKKLQNTRNTDEIIEIIKTKEEEL